MLINSLSMTGSIVGWALMVLANAVTAKALPETSGSCKWTLVRKSQISKLVAKDRTNYLYPAAKVCSLCDYKKKKKNSVSLGCVQIRHNTG